MAPAALAGRPAASRPAPGQGRTPGRTAGSRRAARRRARRARRRRRLAPRLRRASCCGTCGEWRAGRHGDRRSGARGGAEIREAHFAIRVEQHVAGLDVPMHDAALVGVRQYRRHLDQYRHGPQVRGPTQRLQVAAGGEFHRQEHPRAVPLRRPGAQHAGMIEQRGHLRFVLQHGPRLLGTAGLRVKELQCDALFAGLVPGGPDLGVAAVADALLENVAVRDASTGLENGHVEKRPDAVARPVRVRWRGARIPARGTRSAAAATPGTALRQCR